MENNEFHTVRGYQLQDHNKRLLTSAMEDYLEMIYRNSLQEDYLRINKLADLLNVKASSASKMVQKLGALGLVDYQKYGTVILTASGRKMGEFLLQRHQTVDDFLRLLGCTDDILVQTELIEHNINSHTVERLKLLIEFFQNNKDIADRFVEFKGQVGY